MQHLDNPRSARVKQVAALGGRSARERKGAFLAEGPPAVEAALQRGRVLGVYATEDFLESSHPLSRRVADCDPLWVATPECFTAMSDTVTPQGVLAVCALPTPRLLTDLFAVAADAAAAHVALVGVQDPGNVGTIVRAADALGACSVICTKGTADPFGPKAVRASAGSVFGIEVATGIDPQTMVEQARRARISALALSGSASVPLAALHARGSAGPLSGAHMWILGNEGAGLAPEIMGAADHQVAIELDGTAESLNVAMAATVVLQTSRLASAHR